jgi:hypothetical protein
MDKLLRIAVCCGLVATMFCASNRAMADLRVTLSGGNQSISGPLPAPAPPAFGTVGKFNLSYHPSPGATNELPLLSCPQRPCTVYFPSGSNQPDPNNPANDLFALRDNCLAPCASGYAAVTKEENIPGFNVARFRLDNLQITVLGPSTNFYVTYETTDAADMSASRARLSSRNALAALIRLRARSTCSCGALSSAMPSR